MASELWNELLQSSLAISLALLLILGLRRPLRRFGARAAYSAWLLAPMAVIAVLFPAPAASPELFAGIGASIGIPEAIAATAGAGTDVRMLLVLLWLTGAAATLLLFVRQQSAFKRRVVRRSNQAYDEVAGHGPAVFGMLRPRIVLPADFQQRYDADEQQLVLAHEHQHLQRGDLRAQVIASLLRCVFWFNPLVHIAATRFRFDQELACDADVLAMHPQSRRVYAGAMLKTQLADSGLPLGCHWQSSHPLKERIAMLKHPLPGSGRRQSALLLVAAIVATGTYAAWAAQPPTPKAAADTKMAAAGAAAKHAMPSLTRITDEDILTPPSYPAQAQWQSGKVMLNILIDAEGKVQEVKVESSEPAGVFDQAAVEAARQWRFGARARDTLGNRPHGWVRVPVHFEPNDPAKATP